MTSKINSVDKVLKVSESYGKNSKAALKECEKRLNKDPSNYYILLLKACILFSAERDSDSLQLLHTLCELDAIVDDPDYMNLVYGYIAAIQKRYGVKTATVGPEGLKMWLKAMKRRSTQWPRPPEDYLLNGALTHNLLEDARTAMASMMKEHKGDPKYYFAYIAICQLCADTLKDIDPAKATLSANLAYGFMAKSVKDSMSKTASPHNIATVRQFRLMTQIYWTQWRLEELLEALNDPVIGLGSALLNNDWEFVRLKVDALDALKQWRPLWDFCNRLLDQCLYRSNSSEDMTQLRHVLDDWLVWRCLTEASWQLDNEDVREQTQTCLINYINPPYSARNAWLALLHYYAHPKSSGNVLNACSEYFKHFSGAPSCFQDLRPFIETLSPQDQRDFRDTVCAHVAGKCDFSQENTDEAKLQDWVTREINCLKIDYFLAISAVEAPAVVTLVKFARNALRLLGLCQSQNYDETADVGFLAAMALIRLTDVVSATDSRYPLQHLIQAMVILYWSDDMAPENRQVSMLLVQLLRKLGLISLASENYSTLRIKESLHDSLSHLLYNRISTIHPFPTGKTVQSRFSSPVFNDPWMGLQDVLDFYSPSTQKILKSEVDTVAEFQYDQIAQLHRLRSSLESSLTRQLWILETRRISFARASQDEAPFPQNMRTAWLDVADNRDYQVVVHYESLYGPGILEDLLIGPKPGKLWIAFFSLIDRTYCLLTGKKAIRDPKYKIDQTLRAGPGELPKSEFTVAERDISTAWLPISLVTNALMGVHDAGRDRVQRCVNGMTEWLDDASARFEKLAKSSSRPLLPLFEHVEPIFLHLEALRAYKKFTDVALTTQKSKTSGPNRIISTSQVESIRESVHKIHNSIQEYAKWWKRNLEEGGLGALVDCILDGEVGEAMEQVIGADYVEVACADIRDSAEDVVDGILRSKI